MAGQTVKSGLMAKYGQNLDKAVKTHADDETTYGFAPLPVGLKAVCQLIECGFPQYEADTKMLKSDGNSAKGEYYFQARAVIVEPEYFAHPDGRQEKVAGRPVSIIEPVCETKAKSSGKVTTVEEHVDRILLQMRRLGGEDYTSGATGADLESLAAGLAEAKPYFNFSTSLKAASKELNPDGTPKYPAGVSEWWNGNQGLENYSPPDAQSGATQDQSGGGSGKAGGGQTAAPADDEPDLDALIAAAENGDQDSLDKFIEIAVAAGIEVGPENDPPANTFNGAPDFATVKSWIEAGGPPALESESTEYVPAVKDTVKHKPKGQKKQFDCTVTTVNKANRTVTLKNTVGGTVYKDVSWDAIEEA